MPPNGTAREPQSPVADEGPPQVPSDLPRDYDRDLLENGVTGLYLSEWDRGLLRSLERAWDRFHPLTTRPDDSPRIPLVLHQIWLGGKPLPEAFRRFREDWIRLHPHWEHRLWTDEDVADFEFESRDLFEEADNFGMKTVILRCEILRRFGGLYADVDYECLRPLDPLHHLYDFYGTLRVVLSAYLALGPLSPRRFVIDSSLFGAVPGHPLMDRYLATVRRLWPQREEITLGGWARALPRARRERLLTFRRTSQITGNPFGNTIARHMIRRPAEERTVVLPPSWFNPLDTGWGPWRFASPFYWGGMLKRVRAGGLRPLPHYVRPLPHTFAIHHSEGTWV